MPYLWHEPGRRRRMTLNPYNSQENLYCWKLGDLDKYSKKYNGKYKSIDLYAAASTDYCRKKCGPLIFVLCIAHLTITVLFLRCSSRTVSPLSIPKIKAICFLLFQWCERDTRQRNYFWFCFSNAETIEVSVHGHEVEAAQKNEILSGKMFRFCFKIRRLVLQRI